MRPQVHNPVFANSGSAALEQFYALIYLLGRWGYDFYHPVRGAAASLVIDFILAADYGNIWLNIIFFHLHSGKLQMALRTPHILPAAAGYNFGFPLTDAS